MKLKEVASININRISKQDLDSEGDMFFLYPNDILGETIDYSKLNKINSKHSAIKTTISKGDILCVIMGEKCGHIYIYNSEKKATAGKGIAIISPHNHDVHELLLDKQEALKSMGVGVTIKMVRKRDLEEFELDS